MRYSANDVQRSKVSVVSIARADASDFLFGSSDSLLLEVASKDRRRSKTLALQPRGYADSDDLEEVAGGVALPGSSDSLMQASLCNAALAIPAAIAAPHAMPGVAMSCMPMMIPFRVPQVAPQSWMANKRALAFHRCCVLVVYAQAGIALLRFAHGDLIGGIYDAVQAMMGGYATQPDGITFFPSYIMICGFNGVLNLLQVIQNFHGVPIHFLPWMTVIPPVVSLLGAYCGWQFSKEVRAIHSGFNSDGSQDSCLVRMFAADWWPRNFLSPNLPGTEAEAESGSGFDRSRFTAFAGNGQRLGGS